MGENQNRSRHVQEERTNAKINANKERIKLKARILVITAISLTMDNNVI